ncbi:MAG: hypothetical protein ACXVZL_03055 [Gaiellaceae bacterium]
MPVEAPHREHHHHSLGEELHHLHDVAEKGDAGATPAIALGEVLLFLIPVIAVVLGVAFAAYYLAGG